MREGGKSNPPLPRNGENAKIHGVSCVFCFGVVFPCLLPFSLRALETLLYRALFRVQACTEAEHGARRNGKQNRTENRPWNLEWKRDLLRKGKRKTEGLGQTGERTHKQRKLAWVVVRIMGRFYLPTWKMNCALFPTCCS